MWCTFYQSRPGAAWKMCENMFPEKSQADSFADSLAEGYKRAGSNFRCIVHYVEFPR